MNATRNGSDHELGIVVIGRNEGQRLKTCLGKVKDLPHPLVYVDSGSTDGSPDMAVAAGADLVRLDPPYNAGKARNAGFARLLELHPDLQFVQFIEGDCDPSQDWIVSGMAELQSDETLAAVSGILSEKHPESSVYNRLCALEWEWLSRADHTCGGNAMMRVRTFRELHGFDERLIAGEEPEFCLRLHRANWRIRHLQIHMATHDAAITRFSQWWKRSLRNGYSYAACADIHGRGPERYRIRETRSNWFWGLAIPLLVLGTAFYSLTWALLPLAAYPALFLRILINNRRRGFKFADAALLAQFSVLGKFPDAVGQACFLRDKLCNRKAGAIDYKSSASSRLSNQS